MLFFFVMIRTKGCTEPSLLFRTIEKLSFSPHFINRDGIKFVCFYLILWEREMTIMRYEPWSLLFQNVMRLSLKILT